MMLLREQVEGARRVIVDRLQSVCEVVTVAGAIRRGEAAVPNIVVVCLARWDKDPAHEGAKALGVKRMLEDLEREGVLDVYSRNMPRCKQFFLNNDYTAAMTNGAVLRGVPVDVHLTDASNFGVQMMVQTGPLAWTKAVTSRFGPLALLPDSFAYSQDRLWRSVAGKEGMQMVPLRSEREYFRLLGITEVAPSLRSLEMVTKLVAVKRRAA